jgi:hypothetical protein
MVTGSLIKNYTMSQYVIICLREKDGKTIPIPIMCVDEDDERTEEMYSVDEFEKAQDFCSKNILCKNSDNLIIDIRTGEGTMESPYLNKNS